MAMISGVDILAVINPFLKYYVNDSYYIAWRYTPFLVIGYVFVTMGAFLVTSYTVNKDSRGFLFSGCSGAIVNIVLNFMMIPVLGVTGAVAATGISYIVVFICQLIDTRKYMKINATSKRHIVATLVLFMATASLYVDSLGGKKITAAD